MSDWILTLPKYVEWEDYQKELDAVCDRSGVLNYRLGQKYGCQPGERCYLVWRGRVRGWMEIVDMVYHRSGFECETTGQFWRPGWYLQRSGPFRKVKGEMYRGFQGVRRYKRRKDHVKLGVGE